MIILKDEERISADSLGSDRLDLDGLDDGDWDEIEMDDDFD